MTGQRPPRRRVTVGGCLVLLAIGVLFWICGFGCAIIALGG